MHTGAKEAMETKLARIAEVAKNRPGEKFTSLFHHINEEMLTACHQELARDKAPGVDKVTKDEYESNLAENLQKLVERLKRKRSSGSSWKPSSSARLPMVASLSA